jgi:anaerobic magnesium-protoporphyrin IX monomethyl ester cyclase
MTRATFIYPKTMHELNYPTFWLPYSILSVGSSLKLSGWDVNLVDNNVDDLCYSEIVSRIPADTKIVGISTMIGNQVAETVQISRELKKQRPDVSIVVGGPMPTMMPNAILEEKSIDYAVRGQGEITIKELADTIVEGGRLEDIPGISFRGDGQIVSTPNRMVLPRNKLPSFDFELINLTRYIQSDPKIASRTINYISSQGCPFNCGFCSDTNLFDRKYSRTPAEQTVDAIEGLVKKYDVNGIKFYDSNFIINPNLTNSFAKGVIERKLAIKWGCAIHPATFLTLSDEQLENFAKSGCSRMLIGAESGNKEVLDLVGKKIEPSDMEYIAKKTANYNISVSFTAIVGFPNVPDSHYDETFSLGRRLREISDNHEVKIHIYAPFPSTRLYKLAIENGFIPPKTLEDWANYDYYATQTPWVPKNIERITREFNVENSSAVNRV